MKTRYPIFLILAAILSSIGAMSRPDTRMFAQDSVQITAEVLFENVNIRALPTRTSESLGKLSQGTVVNVDALADLYYRGSWIHISEPISQLSGWVNTRLVVFSRTDWSKYVETISQEDIYFDDTNAIEATVYNADVYVRAAPGWIRPTPEIVGQLTEGMRVRVLGISVSGHYAGTWAYVKQVDGDLEGWVFSYYLRFPDGSTMLYSTERGSLPVLFDDNAPANPIQVEGQVIAYISIYGNVHLRLEPNTDSTIITSLDLGALLVIYGRTATEGDGWVYVKVLDTQQTGWVYDPVTTVPGFITYPQGFDRTSLPLLPVVANPAIPSSAAPANSLNAVTIETATLRSSTYPWWNNTIDRFPVGTSVTLIGRNINSTWFNVMIGQQEGWMGSGVLSVEGDFNHLPILSLHDGTRSGGYE
ncbi:MAG: hypothetical protein DPW16_04380 [Chloroflexi bacterium]|nr:hypothetical protein [Chloroflexota bacterium]